MKRQYAAPHWIAVDWSESGMRAWAMDRHDAVLMKVRSAQGLAQVAAEAFETVLFNLVRPWLIREQTPIVVSGLTATVPGVRTCVSGEIPFRPAELPIHPIRAADDRLSIYAFAGLQRAESDTIAIAHESLIRGVANEMPDYAGAICVPDTRTSWIDIDAGEVTGCQAFMSAELADLLAPQSEETTPIPGPAPDRQVFLHAVEEGLCQPERMAQNLIEARTDPDPAKSRLKGLMIGVELAATRALWQGRQVIVTETGQWSDLYALALRQQAVPVRSCEEDHLTLSGLKHAFRSL